MTAPSQAQATKKKLSKKNATQRHRINTFKAAHETTFNAFLLFNVSAFCVCVCYVINALDCHVSRSCSSMNDTTNEQHSIHRKPRAHIINAPIFKNWQICARAWIIITHDAVRSVCLATHREHMYYSTHRVSSIVVRFVARWTRGHETHALANKRYIYCGGGSLDGREQCKRLIDCCL